VTFSTASNPRLGQTPTALTSLGAVGGPRGAGAGALRILVEFLSTYDKKATEQLQNDLRQIDHAASVSAQAEEKRQGRILAVRNNLVELERVRTTVLDAAQRKELKNIENLTSSRTKAHRLEGAARKTALDDALLNNGVSQKDIDLLHRRAELQRRLTVLNRQQVDGEATQSRLAKQRLQTEQQLATIKQRSGSFLPRIQGLALGVIGGFAGAAAFTAISAGVDLLIQSLEKIIDPAKAARESLVDVAKAVLDITREDKLSVLDATAKYLEKIGIEADETTQKLIAQAVIQQRVLELLQDQVKVTEIAARAEQLNLQTRDQAAQSILNEAVAEGKLGEQYLAALQTRYKYSILQNTIIDGKNLEALIDERLAAAEALAASEGYRLLAVQDAMALSAARAATANELLAAALARSASASTAPIQSQISNLSVQPSRRTRRLERAVANAGSGGGNSAQLQNIAEERALILLRQRLRLLGTAINLEKYSGKFLLEAINAKINALQKEGQEQQRVNQLLDLQYRMSQTIRRSQGESISDFLSRRAKENRDLLTEADDLDRQRRIDRLNDLKAKVQDEVALAELSEQRRNALAASGASTRQKHLQKELAASKKHDKEVYEAKKKALEAQLKAEEAKNKEAESLLTDSMFARTKIEIRGAQTLEQLARISGRIAGYERAKGIVLGMIQAFGLPKELGAAILAKINALINAYNRKEANLLGASLPGRSNTTPLQHGGVIQLNNSSSMFGSNVRVGEAGTELGIVLSHKVADILQKQKNGTGQIGPFYLQASGDLLRDKYMLGRAVKEAVSESLA